MKTFPQWLEGMYRNKKGCPYWGDAGSGVIPFCKTTKRFLINHRGAEVNEGGSYSVFGGGIFLDQTPYENTEELAKSDYPQKHALEELKEETGYSGQISLQELYVYKDQKKNSRGEPCDFYYWTYLGFCPREFPVRPGAMHAWEEGGESNWFTLEELLSLEPKHFGLKTLLQNVGGTLAQLVK